MIEREKERQREREIDVPILTLQVRVARAMLGVVSGKKVKKSTEKKSMSQLAWNQCVRKRVREKPESKSQKESKKGKGKVLKGQYKPLSTRPRSKD